MDVQRHQFFEAAGIKDFRWHDCRHTFASRLRQSGTPLGNIAELLGHKTLAMSRRYAHLSIANLHEAVSRDRNRHYSSTRASCRNAEGCIPPVSSVL
jgi:integrase